MPVMLGQQKLSRLLFCILLFCTLLPFQLFAGSPFSTQIVAENRTVKGAEEHKLPLVSDKKVFKPLSGRRVYKRICMACHTMDVWGFGAPQLGKMKVWAPRIAKGKEALYRSALYGIGKMPRRGFCQFCTDGELKAAVDYMVKKGQSKRKTKRGNKDRVITNPNM